MPVWQQPAREGNGSWARVSVARAISKGLTYRSLAETTQATLDWHKTRPADQQLIPRPTPPAGAGLPPEREAAALAAWKAKVVS